MPQEKRQGRKLEEICRQTGIRREVVLSFVERHWVRSNEESSWQEEDVRRAHLIEELQHDFGVNDEAVPIILHLIDQLHAMNRILRLLNLEDAAETYLQRETRRGSRAS